MADQYINGVGVAAIRDWANGKFALDADLDTLDAKVESIIAEGGEPNVIETVKVNDTALVPDAQKAVNVSVPTALSQLTNDGDGTQGSAYATQSYVDTNGGKIDTISVNGTQQTITNKNVDITVPTSTSDLTNDSGFQTGSDVSSAVSTALANNGNPYQTQNDVQTAIGSAVSSAYKYKGSVATVGDLPATGQTAGDVYDVQATGMNYAWNGSAWDSLGQYVDTSLFWQKTELTALTVTEINEILEPTQP